LMAKSFISNIRSKLKFFTRFGRFKSPTDPPQTQTEPNAFDTPPHPSEVGPAEGEAPCDPDKKRRRRRPRKTGNERPAEAFPDRIVPLHEDWDKSRFVVPICEGKTRFHDLDLPDTLLHAIADLGFQYCSPIQAEILPKTLGGKDASGQAQTGTGKTAAFLITILTHIIRSPRDNRPAATPRALILAPTRELAIQIAEEAAVLARYLPVSIVTVYGGTDYVKQRRQLTEQVVDIVVATPGRLIDYCQQDDVRLDQVEILVIDEADRMLDMGFIPQVRRIVRKTPYKEKRQTLFFSATITGDVERLADQMTVDPVTVEIEPEQVEVASVEQLVYLTTTREKLALLYNIISRQDLRRVIIFCNRRDETHRVHDLLRRHRIKCEVISGEIPQKKRMRTLEDFRSGIIPVLVATDVAGRGLHIDGVSHVINFTLPHEPESYVHRIGRTGRAGATGTSISFACEEDSFYLPEIEAFIGHTLPCSQPDEDWLILPQAPSAEPRQSAPGGKPGGKRRRRPPNRSGRKGEGRVTDQTQ